ncbi:hypothetical protein GCM10007079_37550 [Nocardiopsis terrae]|uniref:Uncharacterized protein n=1 Tax=Nocardiopsis terrae TaxID=372655 RepID=A0ABR9HDP0_9ACTN|nr:carboxypeptidase regulatory-like domain-containing protein [Nocardiopsis terrae]MBE1457145.1 hypothetical protein [Nocardiopsis terrae]GHC90873.1 hypothetical protein GCM10007079_37550 [Nocardiopsis terrae]
MWNDPDPTEDRSGRAAALAAFDRSLDRARQARTISDTALAPGPAVHRDHRGAAPTTLLFDLGGVRLDLQIHPRGDHHSLSGLVGGEFDHVDVHVRRSGSTLRLFVGVDGRFEAHDLAPGPLSLAVEIPGRPLAVTDWFTVSTATGDR